MIIANDLHKSFKTKTGKVTAVDGVSFTAHDGQITGLLGPNGAGKTTTMRMLYTLMTPDRGNVTVDWHHRESARASMRILVKRILRRYGYPPDLSDLAVQTVLAQAETLLRGS